MQRQEDLNVCTLSFTISVILLRALPVSLDPLRRTVRSANYANNPLQVGQPVAAKQIYPKFIIVTVGCTGIDRSVPPLLLPLPLPLSASEKGEEQLIVI